MEITFNYLMVVIIIIFSLEGLKEGSSFVWVLVLAVQGFRAGCDLGGCVCELYIYNPIQHFFNGLYEFFCVGGLIYK